MSGLQVKKFYRKACLSVHPDKVSGSRLYCIINHGVYINVVRPPHSRHIDVRHFVQYREVVLYLKALSLWERDAYCPLFGMSFIKDFTDFLIHC